MPVRVQTPHGVVEFPDGMSEQDMAAALSRLPKAAPSHDAPNSFDVDTERAARGATGIESNSGTLVSPGGGRGTRLDVRKSDKWLYDNTPTIAAGAAAAASGGGVLLPSIAAGGAAYLGARVRGDSREDAAGTGVSQGILTAVPGVFARGFNAAGDFIEDRAVPLVRSALKPAFAELRRRAGIEGVTPAALANKQAKFIVDHQLSTPEQAAALVKSSGREVDDAIRAAESDPNVSPVLDTANRIPRYLNALLRRVERQILPGRDRAAIQNVGRELVNDSPLSQSTASSRMIETLEEGLARGAREALAIERHSPIPAVTTQRPRLVNPNLQRVQNDRARTAIMRDVDPQSEMAGLLQRGSGDEPGRAARTLTGPQNTRHAGSGSQYSAESSRPRALRANVRPSEGAEIVRSKSFYDKDASGGQIAGGKAVERAVRDAIKESVPATRQPLMTQGRAMDAERLLDRSAWRDSNRDSMPGGMGAIAGFANGRPLTGLLLQALKEGQLKAGLAAPRVGRALKGTSGPVSKLDQLIRLAQLAQLQDDDQ